MNETKGHRSNASEEEPLEVSECEGERPAMSSVPLKKLPL